VTSIYGTGRKCCNAHVGIRLIQSSLPPRWSVRCMQSSP
jgi:hypothetical protein